MNPIDSADHLDGDPYGDDNVRRDDAPLMATAATLGNGQRLGLRVAAPNRARTLGLGGGANARAARLGIGSGLGSRAARFGLTTPARAVEPAADAAVVDADDQSA